MLVWFIVCGLIAGSFAGMLVHRLPRLYNDNSIDANQMTLWWLPRSHCPLCNKPIPLLYLLPIIGFFLCQGRCSHCQGRVAWRYMALEMSCALVPCALFALNLGWQQILIASVFFWWLLTLAVADYLYGILPDELTLTGLWVGLLVHAWPLVSPHTSLLLHNTVLVHETTAFAAMQITTLSSAVLGAALGYILPWGIHWCFFFMRRKQGMGYGDFKMLAMIGAWLGALDMLFVLLCASLVGIFWVCMRLIVWRTTLTEPIAFGVCIAIAASVFLLFDLLRVDVSLLIPLI